MANRAKSPPERLDGEYGCHGKGVNVSGPEEGAETASATDKYSRPQVSQPAWTLLSERNFRPGFGTTDTGHEVSYNAKVLRGRLTDGRVATVSPEGRF